MNFPKFVQLFHRTSVQFFSRTPLGQDSAQINKVVVEQLIEAAPQPD